VAEGWGSTAGNAALGVADDYTWIKLHIGAPGAAGTANAAANTTRKQVTWTSPSSGAMSNSDAPAWSTGEVTTTENYTHWTAWSASSAGTFGFSGTMTGGNVTAGTAFSIPVGDLDVSLTLAS
jgi:hypothetical protein